MSKVFDEPTMTRMVGAFSPRLNVAQSHRFDVDIDREFPGVRGRVWAEFIARLVQRSEAPARVLFSGLPGTGKSTELARVADMLKSDPTRPLLPAFVDMAEFANLDSPIEALDVLLACVFCALQQAFVAQGKSHDEARQAVLDPGVMKRISEFFRADVALGVVEPSGTASESADGTTKSTVLGGGKIAVNLKHHQRVRAQLRERVLGSFDTFVSHVRDELTEAVSVAAQAKNANNVSYQGIVLIVDSLEKLRGSGQDWEAVVDSMQRLVERQFTDIDLGPQVHVILTVPPALLFRCRALPIRFLPMIKTSSESGRAAVQRIIDRRVSIQAMAQLIPTPAAWQAYQDLLGLCGGFPRDLIEIHYQLLNESDGGPLSEDDIARVRAWHKDRYQRSLSMNLELIPLLASVARNRALETDSEHHRAAERLLAHNLVLRYQNHDIVMDVHPAAKDHPRLLEALQNLPTR